MHWNKMSVQKIESNSLLSGKYIEKLLLFMTKCTHA